MKAADTDTPSTAGVNTPSTAGAYTPSTADNTPSTAGANSTTTNTYESTRESTTPAAPVGEQEEAERLINSVFAPYNFSSLSWEELQEAFKKQEDSELSPCVEDREPSLVFEDLPASSPLVEDSAGRADSKKAEEDRRLEDYRGLPRHLKSEYDRKQRNERQRFDHDAFMAYSRTPVGMEEW